LKKKIIAALVKIAIWNAVNLTAAFLAKQFFQIPKKSLQINGLSILPERSIYVKSQFKSLRSIKEAA